MKHSVKKLLSVFIALSLTLATFSSAFAAETDTVATKPNYDINVMIDGQYMTFNAAVPKIINGRTMVPFRQIFNALGADVTYNDETRVVGATLGDISISFKAGEKELVFYDASGAAVIHEMDVVPYLDAALGTTYVPARFVAEALNYKVDWDEAERTVVIINFEKLFAGLEEDFSIISKFNTPELDANKTYKTVLTMDLLFKLADQDQEVSLPMAISMTALQKGMTMSGDMTMDMDLSELLTASEAEITEEDQKILDLFKNSKYEMKMDEDLNIYIKSNLFDVIKELSGTEDFPLDGETWLKISLDDVTAMYQAMGINIDFRDLMEQSSSMDLQDTIDMINEMDLPMTVHTYSELTSAINVVKTLFGDEAFTVKTEGDTTTYTLTDGQTKLQALLAATGLELSNVDLQMSFSEKNGTLADYNFVMKFDLNQGEEKVSFSFTMSGSDYSSSIGNLTLNINDMIVYSIDISCTVTETDESFTSAPGADEKVVSLSDLVNVAGTVTVSGSSVA